MAKIGSYEYPTTKLGTLLKSIEIIVDTFPNGGTSSEKSLADALGHSTTNSGGFRSKIADLRRYNLMHPRSFEYTDLGRIIGEPLNSGERQNALNKAIMSVDLWRLIYERFQDGSPDLSTFKIFLTDLTNDRSTSINKSDDILSLYGDAISYYSPEERKNMSEVVEQNQIEGSGVASRTVPSPKPGMMLFQFEDIMIQLPVNTANINVIKSVLDGIEDQ